MPKLSDTRKIGSRTKIVASVVVFSALYTILRHIQIIPMIGVPAGKFSASDALAPLYGIILGPYAGGLSVTLGTFLAIASGRSVAFLGLDFLPALANAVAIGSLIRRKWGPVVVLNAVLLLLFLLSPYSLLLVPIPLGSTTSWVPFAWLHIIAFMVLISPLGRKAAQWIETLKMPRITIALVILAFIGTMMQHLTGNLVYQLVLGPISGAKPGDLTGFWLSIFFVYPWERLVLVLLTVVIGTPLIRALKKSFFLFEK